MMSTEEILKKIFDANILDAHDLATVERGLKLQDAYDEILNESMGLYRINKEEPKYNMQYQVAQCFGKKEKNNEKVIT